MTAIAQGEGSILTTLNTYASHHFCYRRPLFLLLLHSWIRRIDLTSKLCAPLFVSALTSAVSYTFAAAFLLGFAGASMVFEFFCTSCPFRSDANQEC